MGRGGRWLGVDCMERSEGKEFNSQLLNMCSSTRRTCIVACHC